MVSVPSKTYTTADETFQIRFFSPNSVFFCELFAQFDDNLLKSWRLPNKMPSIFLTQKRCAKRTFGIPRSGIEHVMMIYPWRGGS